jgi:5-methylcytosine-specific restriction enzyme subunit McrC
MLKAVGSFDIKSTSQSNLKIKPNTILDLYFELFIKEIEYLLHNGLAKKYRKKEGNVNALKGSLQFGKHLQQNLTHKERFYVRYTTYDLEHSLHCIIYKTLKLLKQINTNTNIHGRILSLLLNFPEMPDLKVSEITFDKIVLNRKTQGYKNAIDIARLLLLHYHPDLSKGRNNVLALMFDMNLLWEQFVLISLKKDRNLIVKGQNSKYFWKSINGKRRTIRPDIIVRKEDTNYVIDTKWKLVNSQPSIEDIRQMYAYHHYFKAQKVALLYPGPQEYISGSFINIDNQNNLTNLECGLIFIDFETDINKWQNQIRAYLLKWINTSKEI